MDYTIKIGDILIYGKRKYIVRRGGIVCVSGNRIRKLDIFNAVKQTYNLTEAQIKCRSRRRDIADARTMLCHYLRKYSILTLEGIGKAVGIDHASVLYHLTRYSDLMQTDKAMKANDKDIRSLLFINED